MQHSQRLWTEERIWFWRSSCLVFVSVAEKKDEKTTTTKKTLIIMNQLTLWLIESNNVEKKKETESNQWSVKIRAKNSTEKDFQQETVIEVSTYNIKTLLCNTVLFLLLLLFTLCP